MENFLIHGNRYQPEPFLEAPMSHNPAPLRRLGRPDSALLIPYPLQEIVCREVHNHLVLRKMATLRQAITRLNTLVKRLPRNR